MDVCIYALHVYDIPLHPNVDLASMHAMKETLHKCGPLQGEGCN